MLLIEVAGQVAPSGFWQVEENSKCSKCRLYRMERGFNPKDDRPDNVQSDAVRFIKPDQLSFRTSQDNQIAGIPYSC